MIEKANLKDLVSLYKIEQDVFKNDIYSLSKPTLRYHILKNRLYKIVIEKKIVGYILWLERKKYFRLYSLAISSKYQNKGLAKKLLNFSFKKLEKSNKSFSLEVKHSNKNAIKLYENFGFKITKVLKDYYKDEDGYLMLKK
ncbi:GNAT family N-acetyltransferase [Poseidonibacter sp.]|uniref:GNAT family N-acetyltransferase n=1 Tax=Poseidonibacter sp. TaxID=2321188 RepID=UPI003C75A473